MATLIFNSKFRDANAPNNTLSNCSFPLKNALCGNFKLGQVIAPNSFYNITSANKNLYLEYESSLVAEGSAQFLKVSLPEGYVEDGFALAKLIQTTIFANLPDAIKDVPIYVSYNDGVRFLYPLQVTYDNKANKLFFGENGIAFTRFRFYFNEGTFDVNFNETISNTAYRLCGFNATISQWNNLSNNIGFVNPPDITYYKYTGETYDTPPNPPPANYMDDKERGYIAFNENYVGWKEDANYLVDGVFLVSPSHCELHNGLHHIYFQIKEANNKQTFSHSHDTFTFSVPLLVETGYFTHYSPDPNHNEIINIPNATKVLNIKVIDDDGAEVNFKGLNWTFSLIQQ